MRQLDHHLEMTFLLFRLRREWHLCDLFAVNTRNTWVRVLPRQLYIQARRLNMYDARALHLTFGRPSFE